MGINSSNVVEEIEINATFPNLYKTEETKAHTDPERAALGETITEQVPITLTFLLRLASDGEYDETEQNEVMAADGSLHAVRTKQLARLIIARPAGFDDFPQTPAGMEEDTENPAFLRWLRRETLRYFAAKKWRHIVRYVMAFYDNAALPSELFRSF
jgi:hypothetical protein